MWHGNLLISRGLHLIMMGFFYHAIVFKVEATKASTGAKYPTDAPGSDVAGDPDRNDFWVFNPSSVDINIVTRNARSPINPTVVVSGEIKLIDVNGTSQIVDVRDIGLTGLNNTTLYYFTATAQ